MSFKSLFQIEVLEGGVKVTPSEQLVSMPRDQRIAAIKTELQMCETTLQRINHETDENRTSQESSSHDRDADRREIEVMIAILKNFLKRLLEAHWEVLKPSEKPDE